MATFSLPGQEVSAPTARWIHSRYAIIEQQRVSPAIRVTGKEALTDKTLDIVTALNGRMLLTAVACIHDNERVKRRTFL